MEFLDNYNAIIKENLTKPKSTIILDVSKIKRSNPEDSETDATNDEIEAWYNDARNYLFNNNF